MRIKEEGGKGDAMRRSLHINQADLCLHHHLFAPKKLRKLNIIKKEDQF